MLQYYTLRLHSKWGFFKGAYLHFKALESGQWLEENDINIISCQYLLTRL